MYPFSFLKSETSFTTPSFTLEFDSIANANLLVGDAKDVDDWNDFFDLPTNGNLFTLVKVVGKKVYLVGGSNINIKNYLFASNVNLISVVDNANSIYSIGEYCFDFCTSITKFNLPSLTTAGEGVFSYCELATEFNLPSLTNIYEYGFENCISATSFYLPSCTNLGGSCSFNNPVFIGITGNTIELTVPSSLMTCNGGLPDNDIQQLQSNNTVTVITT